MRHHIALALLLAACGSGDTSIELNFSALVNGAPLACGRTYQGIGASASTLEIIEATYYIHDPQLITARGERVPLELEQDQTYQRERVALLDFEDGTGKCTGGDAATRTVVRGTAADDEYVGVRFEIGLPESMNHLDAATAPAPLNQPGMWWSWKGGFKYMRFDVATRGNDAYYLHLGATACDGTLAGGYTCAAGNVPVVELTGDLATGAIAFDLGTLWADLDVDHQVDFQTDFVPGCMAFLGDPECPDIFTKLGLDTNGHAVGSPTVFSLRGAP